MKASRALFPLLAGMTLLLLGANAVPSVQRKHLLREERNRLERALIEEEREGERLRAEIDALAHDPFYIERILIETWKGVPKGAVPFSTTPPVPPMLVRAR